MKAKKVKGLQLEAPLVDNARRIIGTRVAELRSFAPGALGGDPDDQHDMRIAAKRLRYVLETTGFCFGDRAETARKRARDLQDVLGELHDCDVMLPRVAEHSASLREADALAVRLLAGDASDLEPGLAAKAPNRTAYRGLDVLSVHLQARRALLFDRFVELWGELERGRILERLERATEEAVGKG
jgi:hypothetical protein